MKWVLLIAASTVTITAAANAEPFEPKVKDVCAKSPTQGWVVNRNVFVARLVQKYAGVSAIDLRPDGQPVTYEMQVAAIFNPEQFCKANGCAAETVDKLGSTQIVLYSFLTRNASSYHDASYKVVGPVSVENFLIGTEGHGDHPIVSHRQRSNRPPRPARRSRQRGRDTISAFARTSTIFAIPRTIRSSRRSNGRA